MTTLSGLTGEFGQGHQIRRGHYNNTSDNWREKLKHFVHHESTDRIILCLIIADLFICGIANLLELEYYITVAHDYEHYFKNNVGNRIPDQHNIPHFGNDILHHGERALTYMSFAILFVFFIESIMIMIAEGKSYFTDFKTHMFYYFDFAMVAISITLEIIVLFYEDSAFSSHVFVFGRLWRIFRVVEGMTEAEHKSRELTELIEKNLKDTEKNVFKKNNATKPKTTGANKWYNF